MIFVVGELYKMKVAYELFICYDPYKLIYIEKNTILLFLGHFEYIRFEKSIFVKKFLINNTFVMDDKNSLENPEHFFEPI